MLVISPYQEIVIGKEFVTRVHFISGTRHGSLNPNDIGVPISSLSEEVQEIITRACKCVGANLAVRKLLCDLTNDEKAQVHYVYRDRV